MVILGTGIGVVTKEDRDTLNLQCASSMCQNRPLFVIERTKIGNLYLCDKCFEFIVDHGKKMLQKFREGYFDDRMFRDQEKGCIAQIKKREEYEAKRKAEGGRS